MCSVCIYEKFEGENILQSQKSIKVVERNIDLNLVINTEWYFIFWQFGLQLYKKK